MEMGKKKPNAYLNENFIGEYSAVNSSGFCKYSLNQLDT